MATPRPKRSVVSSEPARVLRTDRLGHITPAQQNGAAWQVENQPTGPSLPGRSGWPRGTSATPSPTRTSNNAQSPRPRPHRVPPPAAGCRQPPAPPRHRPLCRVTASTVDGIESGVARLLIAHPSASAAAENGLGDDWREYRMPVHVLPNDLREGEWLTLSLIPRPSPTALESRARSLRDELGANDDGGDFCSPRHRRRRRPV